MRNIIFGVLAIFCFGCNQTPQDMHFGPGPDDKESVDPADECSSCGNVHN